VKIYDWDPEKNEKLKAERGISFEDIKFCIMPGAEVDVFEYLNQSKYSVDEYAYLVPYVETETVVFLKTIIPSRKATKKYVGD